MRVPFLFWVAWQIVKYTFLFLRWLFKSAFNCINNNGWWKSTAVLLACVVVGYLFVAVLRPDVAQSWRDNWRSLFQNVPRITVALSTPTPQPLPTSNPPTAIPDKPNMPVTPTQVRSTPAILAPTPAPTDTPAPSPTLTPESVATSVPSPTTTPSGLTESELINAREYALKLINDVRTTAGLEEVVLDENSAAQSHAEDMRANCFLSHWGSDGLKPYMRYTLAGGEQYSDENVHGSGFCPLDPGRYRASSIRERLDDAMDSLMNSPGHRRNILKPQHRKVNIGIAFEHPNIWITQQFVGDYIEFTDKPVIEGGVLRMSGTVRNGARINDGRLNITISFDRPRHILTRGQLHRTGCVSGGAPIAALNPFGRYSGFSVSGMQCADPYHVLPNEPAATSYFDKKDPLYESAFFNRQVELIHTTRWRVEGNAFNIQARIAESLERHGEGVYTIEMEAEIDGEDVSISEYSIFIPPHSPTP